MANNMNTAGGWEQQNAHNTKRLAIWTLAWLVTLAIMGFGPRFLWDYNTALSITAAAINIVVGVGMILANKHLLLAMDELEQKIFFDASVTTLGIGLVFAGAFQLLGDMRVIAFDPEIAHVMMVMGLVFLAATIRGKIKYS